MGQTVYDGSGNNLGSVNDIVLDKDGKMAAVVIGVGGFLGIGQKNVAVSIEAINRTTDENGNLKLVLNASKDEIDQAPALHDAGRPQGQGAAADAAAAAGRRCAGTGPEVRCSCQPQLWRVVPRRARTFSSRRVTRPGGSNAV